MNNEVAGRPEQWDEDGVKLARRHGVWMRRNLFRHGRFLELKEIFTEKSTKPLSVKNPINSIRRSFFVSVHAYWFPILTSLYEKPAAP